jgi:DNA-binding transcriptional regulator LsrR (DeoR family)
VSGRAKAELSYHRWQLTWKLTKEGHAQRDIARQLGVSLSTVQHFLDKGQPPRTVQYETVAEMDARLAALHAHLEVLSAALAAWAARDDPAVDQAAARRSASTALGEIDALLRRLYEVRQELITEARRFDDAVNARVDQLLAESRGDGA